MITVDLRRKRVLDFDIRKEDAKNIKSVDFVVSLPDSPDLQFKGHLRKDAIRVELPVLNGKIEKGTEGICYLDVCDQNDVHRKVSRNEIVFEDGVSIQLKVGFPAQKLAPKVSFRERREAVIESEHMELRPTKVTYHKKGIPKKKVVTKVL